MGLNLSKVKLDLLPAHLHPVRETVATRTRYSAWLSNLRRNGLSTDQGVAPIPNLTLEPYPKADVRSVERRSGGGFRNVSAPSAERWSIRAVPARSPKNVSATSATPGELLP